MYLDDYPDRTINQHRTEWLYYRIISDNTGSTAYEVYETMALRFLKVILEDGTLGYVKPSALNTYHHNLYMIQIQAFMAGYGTILPDPSKEIDREYATKRAK